MDGENLSTQQLPTLIKEWMATEEEVRVLSAEIREKRKRAATVRGMITRIMKGNKVGQLNISAGQVRTKTKVTKQPLSKKYIVTALTDFFNGDKAMAEKVAKYLDENRSVKNSESLVLDPIQSP
jgi:hypothetical protein